MKEALQDIYDKEAAAKKAADDLFERGVTALERIASVLESLDEPQTFDLQHDRDGRVIQIKEI